ncbi:hypothetical protein [Sphingomonas sp.]|uniref:hypothetical protein n=1 Tax=Sphingomonas sp. TaxID=28214 RepID=UPI003CC5CC58
MADSTDILTKQSDFSLLTRIGFRSAIPSDSVTLTDQQGNQLVRYGDMSAIVINGAGEKICKPQESEIAHMLYNLFEVDSNLLRYAFYGTRFYQAPVNAIPNLCKASRER